MDLTLHVPIRKNGNIIYRKRNENNEIIPKIFSEDVSKNHKSHFSYMDDCISCYIILEEKKKIKCTNHIKYEDNCRFCEKYSKPAEECLYIRMAEAIIKSNSEDSEDSD